MIVYSCFENNYRHQVIVVGQQFLKVLEIPIFIRDEGILSATPFAQGFKEKL